MTTTRRAVLIYLAVTRSCLRAKNEARKQQKTPKQKQFVGIPEKAKIELSCRRELDFVDFARSMKRRSGQSPSPLFDRVWLILGSIFYSIWGPKSNQNRSPVEATFWSFFGQLFDHFLAFFWSLGRWKSNVRSMAKRCFEIVKNVRKPCILQWKWRVAGENGTQKASVNVNLRLQKNTHCIMYI